MFTILAALGTIAVLMVANINPERVLT